MTAPAEGAGRFLWACLLGAGLGLVYGFLRPLSQRKAALGDGLFLIALFWAWLYHSFAICLGDIRLGGSLGLLGGWIFLDRTVGRLLEPVFSGFWKLMGIIWTYLCRPLKKIRKIAKIMVASGEKWVTIEWNNRRHCRRKPGGEPYGNKKQSLGKIQAGLSPEQSGGEDCGSGGYRIFYAGRRDPKLGPQQRGAED